MSLEDISTIEALFSSGARARAEAADHGALVVRQGVPVLVVLARKALDVVLACLDGALLGAFRLVREHVCLQVLERPAAVWDWADTLFLILFAELVAAASVAVLRSL